MSFSKISKILVIITFITAVPIIDVIYCASAGGFGGGADLSASHAKDILSSSSGFGGSGGGVGVGSSDDINTRNYDEQQQSAQHSEQQQIGHRNYVHRRNNDHKYINDFFNSRERVLESSYHGLIKENESFVEITPLIKVDETKVCDFRIIKKGNHEIPFQIEMINGLGILKAKKTLNCEKHKNFKFDIAAVFCDGSHSKSASVRISVIDINEYSPTFLLPSYVTEVDEGRLYEEIIRVEATDRDCTPLFGDVCKYEILTVDQPFTIDNEGVIRNTEPLSYKLSHNHILSVVAYDCAMKQSAPVMVNINVRRICETRIQGVAELMEYKGNTMDAKILFPKLHLELCDMQCKNMDLIIQSSVTLKTKHISFGCDRDAMQCLRQQQIKNRNDNNSKINNKQNSGEIINLLQRDVEWTKDLLYDEGGPESIFHFDGNTGAIIPLSIVPHHDFALHPFSIITMFRHHSLNTDDKHIKEHIICSADDRKMNRHHMAVFVRNCRLILLLRKNFNEGDLNIFSPAEWRWKIPHVCDNEWHHYVINIDLPKVELYIDGQKFQTNQQQQQQQSETLSLRAMSEQQQQLEQLEQQSSSDEEERHSNPEVIDDWPLHAAHGVNTTLTIGACYQGSESRLKHQFNGDIAEIKLSMNGLLKPIDIKCTTMCAEHLIAPPEQLLHSTEQLQINAQLNEIIIDGTNKTNIEQLLRKIKYINIKRNPTIGRRNLEIRTMVSCPEKKVIRLPTIETHINVKDDILLFPSQSQLMASGSAQSYEKNTNGGGDGTNDGGKIFQFKKYKKINGDIIADANNKDKLADDANNDDDDDDNDDDNDDVNDNNDADDVDDDDDDDDDDNDDEQNGGNSINAGQQQGRAIDVDENDDLLMLSNHVHDKLISDEQKPKILIAGQTNNLVTYADIKHGVRILENITINIFSGKFIHENLQKLDSCSVAVFPSLNPDHEEIMLINNNDDGHGRTTTTTTTTTKTTTTLSSVSATMATGKSTANSNGGYDDDLTTVGTTLNKYDIKTNVTKDGVEMIGYDTIENYLDNLHSLVYANKKPAYYLNRVFKLSCSQINFHSSDFTLTLTVLHPKQKPTISSDTHGGERTQQLLQQQQLHEPNLFAHAMIHSHDIQESSAKIHNVGAAAGGGGGSSKAQSSHSTALIAVICLSFVILICGVGIARLRNGNKRNSFDSGKHQQCTKVTAAGGGATGVGTCNSNNIEQQQLDWDDSALTITINPMENSGIDGHGVDGSNCNGSVGGGTGINGIASGTASISDESSDSENSDSDDDYAPNGRYRNVSQLEWDNSTM